MFIFEILIYVFFAYFMYSLARRSDELYPNEEVWDFNIILYIAFFTIISAIKYCVGGDYFSYARIFEEGMIVEERADQEIIWNTIVEISGNLHLHSGIGFGICAFLQIYFLVKACGDKKYLLITLPVVMFGSRYFIDMEGAIRQMTAACFFIWFSKFIVERKLLKYVVCVFIASCFHHSALILLPLYLIPPGFTLSDKPKMMTAIFLACVMLGFTPQFNNVVPYIENLAVLFGYSGYESRVSVFLTDASAQEALSFGPMMLSYLLTALAIIWFGPLIRRKYLADSELLNLWYNLSFVYACAYFLIANTSHFFIRPVQYLEFSQMMTAALLLYTLINEMQVGNYKYYAIGFIIVLWTNISWDIMKNYENPYNLSSYKTILFNSKRLI